MKRRIRWDRVSMLVVFIASMFAYFNSIHIASVTDTAVMFDEDGTMAILGFISLGMYLWSIYED